MRVSDEKIEAMLMEIGSELDNPSPSLLSIRAILRRHLQTDQPSLAGCDEAFEQWWKKYPMCPRKIRKKKCLAIWHRLWKADDLPGIPSMLATLEAQKRHWQKEEWKYVPLPQTYLNGAQWEDDVLDSDPEPTLESRVELEAKRRLFSRRAIELELSGDWNRDTRAELLAEVGLA